MAGRSNCARTAFQATLPAPQSDLAQQILKDPYNFDFLTLATEARERDLERGLIEHLRHPDDKPSIGIILCKTKNRIVAEYALRNTSTPMGISEFRHLEELPERLKGTLPTIEEIEAELGK
jgi:hypothetical protein